MRTALTIKLAKRLEALARITRQSKSSFASQAIEKFLTLHEWNIQAIKEGVAAADREDFVSHEEAIDELKSWEKSAS